LHGQAGERWPTFHSLSGLDEQFGDLEARDKEEYFPN